MILSDEEVGCGLSICVNPDKSVTFEVFKISEDLSPVDGFPIIIPKEQVTKLTKYFVEVGYVKT